MRVLSLRVVPAVFTYMGDFKQLIRRIRNKLRRKQHEETTVVREEA